MNNKTSQTEANNISESKDFRSASSHCYYSISPQFIHLVDQLVDAGRLKSFCLMILHPFRFWDARRIAKQVLIEQIMSHYENSDEQERVRILREVYNS